MAWFGSATTSPSVNPRDPKTLGPNTSIVGTAKPILAPIPLVDTTLNASTATAAAQAAARKQKQKAMAGSTLLTAPAAGVQPLVVPPASLLGR